MMKLIKSSRLTHSASLAYVATVLFTLFTMPATATYSEGSVRCAFTPQLSCSEAQSGETLWHKPIYTDPDTFSIGHSRLYISHSTRSSSYDLRNGKQIWQVSSDSDAHYFYPILSGENIFLARSDGILEKRRADSGEIIWSRSLADGWVYPPVIQNDIIITGGQNRIVWILDEETGHTLDTVSLSQELVAPLFQHGKLFIGSTFDGQLSAFSFNRQSHRTEAAWQAHLDAPAFSYVSDSEHFVTADMGGKLNSLDPENGFLRWQASVHQNAFFWNTLHRQSLFSLTETGSLSVLDINSGRLQKHQQFDHHYIQAPIVQDDKVALYDTTGAVQYLTVDASAGSNTGHKPLLYTLLTSPQRGILK